MVMNSSQGYDSSSFPTFRTIMRFEHKAYSLPHLTVIVLPWRGQARLICFVWQIGKVRLKFSLSPAIPIDSIGVRAQVSFLFSPLFLQLWRPENNFQMAIYLWLLSILQMGGPWWPLSIRGLLPFLCWEEISQGVWCPSGPLGVLLPHIFH
jgi:hypothetical protein